MSELVFILHTTASQELHSTTLKTCLAQKEPGGFAQITPFSPEERRSLFDLNTFDQKLLNHILSAKSSKEKRAYPYCVTLMPRKTQALLQEISAQGKLVTEEGTLIAPDFYSYIHLSYEIEEKDKGIIHIEPHAAYRDLTLNPLPQDIYLQGPPHALYRPPLLRFFHDTTSFAELQWIKKKKSDSYTLSSYEYTLWLEEVGIESNDPRIKTKTSSMVYIEDAPDPLPVLRLTDKWGSFAQLMMEYEGPLSYFYVHTTVPAEKNRKPAVEALWEKDLLEIGFIRKESGSSQYYCPMDQVTSSLKFLLDIGWKILDSQGKRVLSLSQTQCTIEEDQGAFLVQGTFRFNSHQASLKEVSGLFYRKERFVELSEHCVGLLSIEQTKNEILFNLLQEADLIPTGYRLNKNHVGMLGMFEALHDNKTFQVEITPLALAVKHSISQNFNRELLPSSLFHGDLRPYQQKGVNWLEAISQEGWGGILADDMGLGKTVQILAYLSNHLNSTTLIVAPTSLLFNWFKEIQRFLPEVSVEIYHGKERKYSQNNPSIVLTSYSILRKDIAVFEEINFETIVLDEAQAIKNSHTLTAQAIYKLKGHSRFTVTGTPIENSLQELWAQFRFLNPGLLGSLSAFSEESQSALIHSAFLDRMRAKIKPYILRRKKEEVAPELPEKIEQTVFVTMTEEQRTFYTLFLEKSRKSILKKPSQEGLKRNTIEILEILLRLRQICCHPTLVPVDIGTKRPSSAKFDLVLDEIRILISERKKVLLFSQFSSMLHLFSQHAYNENWNHVLLDGETRNREEIVEQFQTDPNTLLFLISLKAGGVGLNLTAADYVLLYDPWWNVAAEEQAIDRAHRIGRSNCVVAKRYITLNSIEEKITLLKKSKSNLSKQFLESEEGSTHLSSEELFALLQ